MAHLRSIKRLHGQRGIVTVLFALVLVVLLGFIALAIDLTRLHLVKVELQSAADAAALAGAGSLIDSGTVSPNYNWTAAYNKAQELAGVNSADGKKISQNQNATVQVVSSNSYWNIQNPDGTLHTFSVPPSGYVPAVQATVTIQHLQLFFAPILGISEGTVNATAIAAVSPPMGGTGLFPFTIGLDVFDNFWDRTTNKPKTPNSFVVSLESYYPTGGQGTWTSLTQAIGDGGNDVPTIGGIINSGGNTTPIYIGQDIWVANGDMSNLYMNKPNKYPLPIGKPIGIPVIETVNPGTWQPIIAIAGFVIDTAVSNGTHSYITGHFIDATTIPGLNPGNGTGTPYGAYTPPFLVK